MNGTGIIWLLLALAAPPESATQPAEVVAELRAQVAALKNVIEAQKAEIARLRAEIVELRKEGYGIARTAPEIAPTARPTTGPTSRPTEEIRSKDEAAGIIGAAFAGIRIIVPIHDRFGRRGEPIRFPQFRLTNLGSEIIIHFSGSLIVYDEFGWEAWKTAIYSDSRLQPKASLIYDGRGRRLEIPDKVLGDLEAKRARCEVIIGVAWYADGRRVRFSGPPQATETAQDGSGNQ